MPPKDTGSGGPPLTPQESTVVLLERWRAGDADALNRLMKRYLPVLERWAHGRLPQNARDFGDTGDLVQETFRRALSHLDAFEVRRDGAFLAYLRTILMNRIRDECRRLARRPEHEVLDTDPPLAGPSPLDEVIGRYHVERFEAALARLPATHREAVILRVELGFTYAEIAAAIGSPSTDAACKMVTRALVRVAKEMNGAR